MEEFITRVEHEEFTRRMEDEHVRQNKRIELLEKNTASVEKLAVNMENMLKEQVRQGKRLDVLESRDGEMWRKVVGYAVTAVVGIVVGYVFTRIGF